MGRLFDWIFRPPPFPSFPPHTSIAEGARIIMGAFELAYKRGVLDGLLVGMALSLLFTIKWRDR